jgi:hypothetical protein
MDSTDSSTTSDLTPNFGFLTLSKKVLTHENKTTETDQRLAQIAQDITELKKRILKLEVFFSS